VQCNTVPQMSGCNKKCCVAVGVQLDVSNMCILTVLLVFGLN